MIIKLENYQSHYRENKVYNDNIREIVTELFETNSLGRIKYIISTRENFYSNERHQYFGYNKDKKEYLNPQEDELIENYTKYKTLGPLEYTLASYLLNKNIGYDVFILTGALGSGKTSLCNYTLDYIQTERNPENDPLHFPMNGRIYRYDFNEHFNSTTKDKIVEEFKLLLIAKLIDLIEDIHQEHLFIDKFINEIRSKKDSRLSIFSDFVRQLASEKKTTEEKKFSSLLLWIQKYEYNLSYELRLLSYLLAYVKDLISAKQGIDFIILFDNIDRINDDAQLEILNVIFSFSIKLRIRILIPMRLTTFGKIRGNGSYSFAVLQNTGHPPISIFSERVKQFLKKPDDYQVELKISSEYQVYMKRKMEYLLRCLEDKMTFYRLSNFYTSIAGNSIRRGLFLSERFYLNSAFSYKEDEYNQDEFLKALLVSENEHSKFSADDRLVNNLFSSFEGINTLIKIRILQILNYFREQKWVCRMGLLLSQIGLFEEYSNDDTLIAINDLIFHTRRLIYIEGVVEYSDYNNLSQSTNDIIEITYSGTEYLNTLIFHTVYLQNCFITINWKIPNSFKNIDYIKTYADSVYLKNKSIHMEYLRTLLNTRKATITDFISPAYDYYELRERMKLLRECLYFLMINDINQIAIYLENNNIHNIDAVEDRYIKHSIIIDIIARVSISAKNILKTRQDSFPEVENWYSLLILADLWNYSLFKVKNKYVNDAIGYYDMDFKS